MKKIFATIIAFVFFTKTLSAFDLGAGDWLSGQNQVLSMILKEQKFANTKLVTQIIPNSIRALETAENMGRNVKNMKNLSEAAERYSFEEFVNNARGNLFSAFPEMRELISTIKSLKTQWKSMRTWDFKSVNTPENMPDERLFEEVISSLRTDMENMINISGISGKASTVDKIVYGSMFKSGMENNILHDMGHRKIVGGMIDRFVKSTEIRKNVVSKAVAAATHITAEIQQNQSRILSEMNRIMKMKHAAAVETGVHMEKVDEAFYNAFDKAVKSSGRKNISELH